MGPSPGTVKLYYLYCSLDPAHHAAHLVPQPDEDEEQANGDGDQARVQEDIPVTLRHLPPVLATILCNVSC